MGDDLPSLSECIPSEGRTADPDLSLGFDDYLWNDDRRADCCVCKAVLEKEFLAESSDHDLDLQSVLHELFQYDACVLRKYVPHDDHRVELSACLSDSEPERPKAFSSAYSFLLCRDLRNFFRLLSCGDDHSRTADGTGGREREETRNLDRIHRFDLSDSSLCSADSKADLVSEYVPVLLGCAAVSAFLLLAAYLLRNHFEGFDRLVSILGILAFAGLIGISFLLRNGEYGYSYFFKEQSEMMSMNLFNHFSTRELIRNLIYYMLFAFAFLHHGEGMRMKRFILFLILLFVNPLVTPAVCRFMTSEVYFRVFDLVLNPFVIVFLIYHASFFVPGTILNPEYHFILCFISAVIGLMNLMNYYSKSLIYKDPGWDWKLKASNDSMELYDFIQTNLSDTENKPSILSQDINLKGYVTGITLPFTSADYREVLADPEQYADKTDLVQLLYPSMRYTDQNPFGTELNYDNLPQVILNEGADYLLISNVTSVWNPRGWYDKVYLKMINSGLCTMEYQNDTWALLKISKDYQAEEQEGN